MNYEFEVIGDIKGKDRPRVNIYTSGVYTPKNTKEYESLIKQYFLVKYPRYVPLENRVFVKIIAYFKMAKQTTKKAREEMLAGNISPRKKPDIDNIVKIVLDALNTLAFKDDYQVTKVEIEKKYAEEEKLIVKVEEY